MKLSSGFKLLPRIPCTTGIIGGANWKLQCNARDTRVSGVALQTPNNAWAGYPSNDSSPFLDHYKKCSLVTSILFTFKFASDQIKEVVACTPHEAPDFKSVIMGDLAIKISLVKSFRH